MTNFIELSDKSIINVNDIVLLNVDKIDDGFKYTLYLRGKGMTLKLSETDYRIVRKRLLTDWTGRIPE